MESSIIFSNNTKDSATCRWIPGRILFPATLRIILCACISLLPNLVRGAEESGTTRGVLGEYFGSALGELTAFVDVYTKDADPDLGDDPASIWAQLILRNNVTFFESWHFDTELIINATNPNLLSGSFPKPGVINPDPPYVDFRTFMLAWQGANTEVKLGKGVIEVGYSELFSPVDRFDSQNYSTPQHFGPRGDVQLSISRFFSSSSLTFTLLPFNADFIDPPSPSRWLNSRGDLDFFDQTGAKDEDRPHHFPEDWGYLLLFNGVGNGYDYYLGVHYGQSAYPVVQFEGIVFPPKTKKLYPTASSALAGIRGTVGSWSYFVDFLYQQTQSQEDNSFARWAIGFSYRESKWANKLGLVEIRPVLTYSGDKVVDDKNTFRTVHNSDAARPHPDSLLGRVDFKFTDRALMYLLGSKNFTEKDSSFGFGFTYFPTDSLTFSADSFFMHGEDNTQLGRWRDNDFISLGVNYRF